MFEAALFCLMQLACSDTLPKFNINVQDGTWKWHPGIGDSIWTPFVWFHVKVGYLLLLHLDWCFRCSHACRLQLRWALCMRPGLGEWDRCLRKKKSWTKGIRCPTFHVGNARKHFFGDIMSSDDIKGYIFIHIRYADKTYAFTVGSRNILTSKGNMTTWYPLAESDVRYSAVVHWYIIHQP